VSVVGPGDNQRVRISSEHAFAIAGGHERAQVRLKGEQVGLRHAYFQVLGSRVFLIDLGSQTGVREGHVRLMNGWLNRGKFVRVGPYHLSCNFTPEPSTPDIYSSLEDPLNDVIGNPDAIPSLAADILVRNVRQSRWRMNRGLVLVGSSPLARLRLRDPSVSRLHCILVGTPLGIWVVDLLSRGGIFRNGLATSCARIEDGDCLQVGCFEIRCRVADIEPRQLRLSNHAPLNAVTRVETSTEMPLLSTPSGAGGLAECSALLPILQQFGSMQQLMMDQFQQSMMTMMQMFTHMHHEQLGLIRQEMANLQRLTQELQQAQKELTLLPGPTRPEPRPIPEIGTPRVQVPGGTLAPQPVPAEPALPRGGSPNVHGWLSQRIANLEQERQTVWQRMLSSVLGR